MLTSIDIAQQKQTVIFVSLLLLFIQLLLIISTKDLQNLQLVLQYILFLFFSFCFLCESSVPRQSINIQQIQQFLIRKELSQCQAMKLFLNREERLFLSIF